MTGALVDRREGRGGEFGFFLNVEVYSGKVTRGRIIWNLFQQLEKGWGSSYRVLKKKEG